MRVVSERPPSIPGRQLGCGSLPEITHNSWPGAELLGLERNGQGFPVGQLHSGLSARGVRSRVDSGPFHHRLRRPGLRLLVSRSPLRGGGVLESAKASDSLASARPFEDINWGYTRVSARWAGAGHSYSLGPPCPAGASWLLHFLAKDSFLQINSWRSTNSKCPE